MWRLLLLFCGAAAFVSNDDTNCSSCIKVDGFCHNVTFLFNLTAPFRKDIVIMKMGIFRTKNILYYSFEPKIEDPEYFKVAYVNLDDHNKNGSIADNSNKQYNFGTFDIDQDNAIIYLGGSNGIYYTRNNNDNITWYSSLGDTIKSIFYKGIVYFVPASDDKIIKKDGSNFETHLDVKSIKNFVISDKYITIYLNNYGLFATNKVDTVLLSKNNYFRGITIDLDNNVYAWWIDGIYKIELDSLKISHSRIKKVATISNIGAVVFDNDNNMLITYQEGLFRLTKTTGTDC